MSLEHPNFFNSQDRQLYYELGGQVRTRKFTKEEDYFLKLCITWKNLMQDWTVTDNGRNY